MVIARLGNTVSLVLPLAAFGALGCRQAAGVLFDVPPPAPPVAVAPNAAVRMSEDTVRPPIESVRNADSVVALLPKNADGGIDWGAALRQGVIKPRKARPGAHEPNYLEGFGYDVVLPGGDGALFPHSGHVGWLTCEACHPTLVPRRGTETSMDEIDNGKSCGVCHRTVAFSNEACSRCHPAFEPSEFTPTLDTGIALARKADSDTGPEAYPPSRFAHDVHRIRYRCSACHPGLFAMQARADTLTMDPMRAGASCGACHDGRAAFAIAACDRCHIRIAAPPR